MENFMSTAADIISGADVWLVSISALLVALAGIAKLTKTKKDDKYIQLVLNYVNKATDLLKKLKPSKKV